MRRTDTHSMWPSLNSPYDVPEERFQSTDDWKTNRYYCLSILDKHHHPDITMVQGIKLLNMCIDELKRRLPIDFKGMTARAIKADGIVDIELDDDRVVKSA